MHAMLMTTMKTEKATKPEGCYTQQESQVGDKQRLWGDVVYIWI